MSPTTPPATDPRNGGAREVATSRSRSRSRRAALLGAGLVVVAALAACGGAEEDGAAPPASSTTRVEVLERGGGREGAEAGRGRFDPSALYDRVLPGVVTVFAASGEGQGAGGGGRPGSTGLGSGFVVSGEGEIVTNAHVVTQGEGRRLRRVERVFVRFADRNQVPARIVGVDPFNDVALLRLETTGGLSLRPLPLVEPGATEVGEPVAAIGSPFGEEQSLSVGVVSALDRSIRSLTGFQTVDAVQTDAAINRGNSGGPLLDAEGGVVGINAQIETSSGDGSGVGFAISADVIRRSIEMLRQDGRTRYAYFGVSTLPVYPQLAERFDLGTESGAWVQGAVEGGPAAEAGIRGGGGRDTPFQVSTYTEGGDVITRVGDRRIEKETDLAEVAGTLRPGQVVSVRIVRDGRPQTVRLRVGTRPLTAPTGG